MLVTYEDGDRSWLDGRLDGFFSSRLVGSAETPLVYLYERQ
jgi:hypothetical protein